MRLINPDDAFDDAAKRKIANCGLHKLTIGPVGRRAKIKRHSEANRSAAIRNAQTVQVESREQVVNNFQNCLSPANGR